MWIEFKRVKNQIAAEMWKDILESEGLPCRMLPDGDVLDWSERSSFVLYLPKGREHDAEEILRKL